MPEMPYDKNALTTMFPIILPSLTDEILNALADDKFMPSHGDWRCALTVDLNNGYNIVIEGGSQNQDNPTHAKVVHELREWADGTLYDFMLIILSRLRTTVVSYYAMELKEKKQLTIPLAAVVGDKILYTTDLNDPECILK